MTTLKPFSISSLSLTLEYVEGTATRGIKYFDFLNFFEKLNISFGLSFLLCIKIKSAPAFE